MTKPGRNQPCPCESGKKYKHCCGVSTSTTVQARDGGVAEALKSGLELHRSGKLQEAEAIYRQILSVDPENADALHLLGALAHQVGKNELAIELLTKALSLRPSAGMHYNLGLSYHAMSNLDQALAGYRAAARLEPNWPDVHNNIGVALLDSGQPEQALTSYLKALSLQPDNALAFSNYLLAAQYGPNYTAHQSLADHKAFADRFEAPLKPHWPSFEGRLEPERRLRVGFVSGDFRNHPVGFFLESVLCHLVNRELDVYLYSTNPVSDSMTARLRAMSLVWRTVYDLSDVAAAALVRSDSIDILVDLAGHSAHNRLLTFAYKSAPVQVSWLGYFASTGLESMDYVLADPHSVPEDEAGHFVEKVWLLPATRLCFTPPQDAPDVGALPAIHAGAITFACFNNLAKINDSVLELWARILIELPDSRLLLKSRQYDNHSCRNHVLERLDRMGLDRNRVLLEGFSTRTEYLNAYNKVDIALDPFPFPGGATTMDGLWMGVPVVTMRGDKLIARQGSALLQNLGLCDWIANDADEYQNIAVSKARDLRSLAALRTSLRGSLQASPLCDAPTFSRNLEAALLEMWKKRHSTRSV